MLAKDAWSSLPPGPRRENSYMRPPGPGHLIPWTSSSTAQLGEECRLRPPTPHLRRHLEAPLSSEVQTRAMSERTVNARQREVLGWIVDGCPDGVMTDPSYKTTAVALRNRRLVTVTKKSGHWRAEATDAGRHFAAHGEYPRGHWAAVPAPTSVHATPALRTPSPVAPASTRRVVTGLRPVDQMMADLADAGGSLEVDNGIDFKCLVASANRYGKVPDGKILQLRWTASRQAVVELVDQPAWMTATLEPIPIPATLAKPHPAIATLKSDFTRLTFRAAVRGRALRLLNAIAHECQRRGHQIQPNPANQRSREHVGELIVSIQGHDHYLLLVEQNDRVPHVPTTRELREQERSSWVRIPTHDHVPSGRLEVKIHGGFAVRGDTFADTKTLQLEDRLPALIQELELRAAEAERGRLEREAEAARKREQWERVWDQAVLDFTEHHRGKVLADRAERWAKAQQIGAHLDAMRSRIQPLTGEARTDAEKWLAWATTFAKTLDPLGHPIVFPSDPTPKPEDLRPFMRGLSPYGPDRE